MIVMIRYDFFNFKNKEQLQRRVRAQSYPCPLQEGKNKSTPPLRGEEQH